MSKVRASSDSGEIVLDRLPLPKSGRDSAPRLPTGAPRSRAKQRRIALVGGALLAAAICGFVARPYVLPDARIAEAEARATAASAATTTATERIAQLEAASAAAKADARRLTERLKLADEFKGEIADKEAAIAKRNAAALEVKAKIAAAIEKGSGITVEVDGLDVKVAIPDKVLFKPADDMLSERGTKQLARLASVLKTDVPDRHIAVQGHTDDQPVPAAAPSRSASSSRGKKGAATPVTPTGPRFRTNWELAAARALAVIHYFQDTARLEPTRLAALAFGQYKPASTTEKAKNRRLELVLSPRAPAQ